MKVRRFLVLAVCIMSLFLSSCALPNALETGGIFPHEHSYTATVIAPTQTEQGYTEYTCACGDSYIADYTDALESLSFEKIEGKEEYAVTGLGTVQALEITIPETYNGLPVTQIAASAFHAEENAACANFTKMSIPTSVTVIGSGAFFGCAALNDVFLHDGITEIGDSAFSACTALSKITLPSGITKISTWTFIYCENLTEITIPASVTFIAGNAFRFTGLTAAHFEDCKTWRAYSRTFRFVEEISGERLKDSAFAASFLKEKYILYHLYEEGNYPENAK